MATTTEITELDILDRIVGPDEGDLDPDAARAILRLKFDSASTKQIRQLLQKNNRGTISVQERLDLEKFLRVGKFIDVLHAKARLSLKNSNGSH